MWNIPKYITYSTQTPKLGEEKFVSKQPACLGSWFQGDRVVPEKNHLIQKTHQVWHKPYLILAHTNVQLNSSHSCSQTRDCCFSCVFASHLIPFWLSTLWRWSFWRMNSPLMMLTTWCSFWQGQWWRWVNDINLAVSTRSSNDIKVFSFHRGAFWAGEVLCLGQHNDHRHQGDHIHHHPSCHPEGW